MDQRRKNTKKSVWVATAGLALALFAVAVPLSSGSPAGGDVRAAEPSAVLLDTSWPVPTP